MTIDPRGLWGKYRSSNAFARLVNVSRRFVVLIQLLWNCFLRNSRLYSRWLWCRWNDDGGCRCRKQQRLQPITAANIKQQQQPLWVTRFFVSPYYRHMPSPKMNGMRESRRENVATSVTTRLDWRRRRRPRLRTLGWWGCSCCCCCVVLPLLVFVAVCTSFYRNGRGLLSITIHIIVVNKLFFSGLTHSRIPCVCTYISTIHNPHSTCLFAPAIAQTRSVIRRARRPVNNVASSVAAWTVLGI